MSGSIITCKLLLTGWKPASLSACVFTNFRTSGNPPKLLIYHKCNFKKITLLLLQAEQMTIKTAQINRRAVRIRV
jgi:hypothetical protein